MKSKQGTKKSFFLGEDAREISKEFNASLGVCYEEGFSDEKALRLQTAIDLITQLMQVPDMAEAILKKSGIDLSIQVETLSRKIKGNPEADEKLRQVITRFFSQCTKLQNVKLEVTQKKLQDHVAGQEIQEVSIIEIVTIALKRVSSPASIENSLRAFKIFLNYQEYKRKQGDQNIPQFLDRSQILMSSQGVLKLWEDLIYASFISMKNIQNNNSSYLRLIDLLVFVVSLGNNQRLEVVKSGGIRVLMQKMKEESLTCESTRKSLTLLRDLCYKDSSTASLMGHHEIENHMLIVLQKFRGDREIENLASQILEQTIYGFDPDLENFQSNIKQTEAKLTTYLKEEIGEEDLEKAQYNIGIIYFYSLMQIFTRRLLSLHIHDLLLSVVQKEQNLTEQSLQKHGVIEEHQRILSDSLIILKRVLQLSETASMDKKLKENIPQKLATSLLPNLLAIFKSKAQMKDVIIQAVDCLRVLVTNETTKQTSISQAVSGKITDQLNHLKEIYRDDFKMVKNINNLYFHFAKLSQGVADTLNKNSLVSNLVKQFSAKTTSNKQEQRRNLEYLNDLVEIPTTAKAIIEQGGINFIKNYLKEENKESKNVYLADNEKIDEHVYNLNEEIEDEEEDEDQDSRDDNKKEDISSFNTQTQASKEPSNPVEILRKLIQNHNEDLDKFINADIIQEVLKYLRLQASNRETVFATLRVLQQCADEQKTLTILDQNKAMESIFIALNQHPTDADLCGLAGLILDKLGANQLSKDVKEQYDEMGKTFNIKDEEMVEGIRQANIYLSNLLTALPLEETDEIIADNKQVVKSLDKILRPGLPTSFMISYLLLIIRLCNQGEETKTLIRESGIPPKIVQYLKSASSEDDSSRLIDFCMESLFCMIGGGSVENILCTLDPNDGRDEELESENLLKEYLGQLSQVLANDQVLEIISKQLQNDRQQFQKMKKSKWRGIQQSSQLLSRLIECNKPIFGEKILKILGDERALGLWDDLIQEERLMPLKTLAFTKMGRLISTLCKISSSFFTKFSTEQQISWIIETILNVRTGNDELEIDTQQHMTLKSVLTFLQVYLDSKFDKTKLVNSNLPAALFKLFQRLSNRTHEVYESSPMVCSLLIQVSGILEKVLEDNILCYDLTKNNLIAEIFNFATQFPDDLEPICREDSPQDATEIVASATLLERSTEYVFKLLNSALNQSKYAQYASRVYFSHNPLVSLAAETKISAYSLTKILQILYSLIVCFEIKNPLVFPEPLEDIKDKKKFTYDLEVIQKAISRYPNIPILKILFRDIKKVQGLLIADDHAQLTLLRAQVYGEVLVVSKIDEEIKQIGKKVEQHAEQVKQEQNDKNKNKELLFEDLRKDDAWEESQQSNNLLDVMKVLEKIAISLERLCLLISSGDLPDETQFNLNIKLLEMARKVTVEEGTALKAHNIGITDYLLNLLVAADMLSQEFSFAVAATLSHLTKYPKALKKIENDIDFADGIAAFLSFVLDEDQETPSIKPLQTYLSATLEVLETMKNITAVDTCIIKIVRKKGVQQCVTLFERAQDITEILIKDVDILDKLSYHNKEALEVCATKITPYLNAFCLKHQNNLEAFKVFSLLGGTLCRDFQSQIKLGTDSFHKTILGGMLKFADDKHIITNSFYSLSGLAYNNKENCNAIMSTDILEAVKFNISKFMSEHQVIETICSLLSNLTFKNEVAKKKLGDVGVTDMLGEIFTFYANQRTLNSKTTKQVLRAIGNSSLTIENATKIVDANFVTLGKQIIVKMNYQEEGDVLRYCIDVIGNLASHPEQMNHQNTTNMFKEGAIDLILKVIEKNQLNSEIIASCIDSIDGLIQNKDISVVVAQSDAILSILKIVKSQDWNENILIKGTRVLSNISAVRMNIDQLLKCELPLVIGNLLKNLQKPNDKIINYCFRILNRIAAEKVKEKQMLQSGLVEALGEGLGHSSVNPDCIFNYISLLKSLAKLPNAIQIIGEKSIGNAILRANENKLNIDIVGVTIVLVSRVVKYKPAVANIVDNGGIDFLIQTARTRLSDLPLLMSIVIKSTFEQVIESIRIIIQTDEKYRQAAQVIEEDLNFIASKTKDPQIQSQLSQCLFALLNQKEDAYISTRTKQKIVSASELTKPQKDLLTNGIQVKLFRSDGSNKSAVVKLNPSLTEISAFKKGGSAKEKYQFAIADITDYKFNYTDKSRVWELSTFSKAGGLFSKKPTPECCITIFGPTIENERKAICIECQSADIKKQFQEAFLIQYEKIKSQTESSVQNMNSVSK